MKIYHIRRSTPLLIPLFITTLALAVSVFMPVNRIDSKAVSVGPRYDTIPKDPKQKDQIEASQKLTASGDAYFKAKDYLNAKAAYQQAVSLDPNNAAAKDKLQQTMELLRSQKAQNILFDVAISSADKLFQAGEYEKAKAEYENAGRILPNDPYPKNKINEIIKIQTTNQVKEAEYAKAIAGADKFYAAQNYRNALLDYQKAAGFKPDEQYPQDRIKELTALIATQKEKDEAYKKAIALADQQFQSKTYQDARGSYQQALTIKPEQAYPKEKIKEIESILARIANAQAEYDKYIALADSQYIDKKYFQARENYMMASSVKPAEAYPKEMISKAEKMLSGQEAAMAKALEEQYQRTISGADKLLSEKSYELARAEYVKASNLKPGEQYPKEKISEIETILANALKDKENQYKDAIAAGDRAMAGKIYETARKEYQGALAVKPNETYPKAKIAEIDKLIAEEARLKAADARYANTIGKADSLFMAKAYLPSKTEFQNASRMKPEEVYPKNKIAEIDQILAALEKLKQQDAQYAALLAKADKLLAAKSYEPARAEYVRAENLQPVRPYPKEKIAEIDKILADLAAAKALDEQYRALIASADKLLAAKSYDQARAEYVRAEDLQPVRPYPKEKIAEIDKILADIAAARSLDENYQATIAAADRHLAEKNYDQARSEYVKAKDLKPAEKYPPVKIAEIDAVLASIAKQKALDDDYLAAVTLGDKQLAEQSYEAAKGSFSKASGLKPAEEYPKTKLAEIAKALADLAAIKQLNDQYAAAIAAGDKLLAAKNYDQARVEYVRAEDFQPLRPYPKEKIAEIDQILADLAAAKALEEQYRAAIASADKLLAAKSYEQARAEYGRAEDLQPVQAYPKEKIAEIDKILADIAAAKSLDENYQATIAAADRHLAEKSYDQARSEYVKAKDLKPAEKYPPLKITEIDGILASIAKQKALDDEYTATITLGDQQLGEKSFENAKTTFTKAAGLKPSETYPKTKLAEIDQALAEIARLKALDDQYSAAIGKADKLLVEKKYDAAKQAYADAGKIKPSEQYPKDQIAEIERILADMAAAKALEDKYNATIAQADKMLAAKSYDQARTEYVRAENLQPEREYPKTKIAEINRILDDLAAAKRLDDNYKATLGTGDQLLTAKQYAEARTEYLKASEMKPAEEYPKGKIAEIDAALAAIAKQKALDEEYAAAITLGDQQLGEKSYDASKASFTKASGLKPAETYPKTKLAEIEKALNDIARLKAIDDQYATAILKADKLLQEKSYDAAKTAYAEAGKVKPAEQYPKEKITEIEKILADLAAAKALMDQYQAAINQADKLLASKNYDQARAEYVRAENLQPVQAYPKEKIAEIDGILAEIKAKEEAFNASVAAADKLLAEKKYEEARTEYQNALAIKPSATYPKEKIGEISRTLEELLGKQKYYDKLIVEADDLLKDKDYMKSKETYQQASNIFPAQTYPKQQISMITARIDSLYRANKAFYDKAVADGDRFFNNFEFDKAVDAYTEASNFLPMEKYPREQIVKIRRTIAENAIVDVLNSTVTITSNDEKQFAFTPVNVASRKNNFVYIKIKNLSGKPFNVLMRYGKDKQANGGVVMRNLNLDGKVNERLVSVRDQDPWSREDNNWISLTPQGGDVEVSFIQVSRAK